MKNISEYCLLALANITYWTVNDLSQIEMFLKVVFLVLSILIALKKLFSKKGEKN